MSRHVCFDFDGVIHSYTSGWQGVDVITDPPVKGIKELLDKFKENMYKVAILSTRCRDELGRKAMEEYLLANCIPYDDIWDAKHPAIAYVDDRAFNFTPDKLHTLFEDIENFKPWCKTPELYPGAAQIREVE